MTNICREMGKRLEERHFLEWGGKPTTQLLRHRDAVIDSVTKRRYHAFLASRINMSFPDAEQEKSDPSKADEAYQSGARWLLDHTRPDAGKQFDLLFRENIAYGFRRNALGVKPVAIATAIGCFVWTLAKEHVLFGDAGRVVNWSVLPQLSPSATASLAVSAVMLLVWLVFFTESSLRTSAISFAQALLRTCDTLQ